MAINRTRWRPDTCGCVLELEWDSLLPEESRTHTVTTHTPCAFHAALGPAVGATLESGAVVPHEQNTRVGRCLNAALTRLAAKLQQVAPDGTATLKNGISFVWAYSGTGANRLLTVQFVGVVLTTAERNQLQAAADAAFGAGSILVVA